MRKHYDAIVIGTALGGLISGALLARRGLEVLVLNQEQLPWMFSFAGFDIQRENLGGHGFKRYIFETIFEELDLKAKERSLFERHQPSFQIIQPHHRIDVGANRDRLLREYRREFSNSFDAIQKFYAVLDEEWKKNREKFSYEGFKQPLKKPKAARHLIPEESTRHLKTLFADLDLPVAFRQNILAQISFLSHLHTQDPTISHAAQVLCGSNRKDYYFVGQAKDLAQIFYDRIVESGGSIRDDAYAERLLVGKNECLGVRLNTYEGVVDAPLYIGNMDVHRLYDLVNWSKTPRAVTTQLEQLQPSYAKCVFFAGVETKVLPVGMDRNVVMVLDETRPLLGDNLVFLQIIPEPHKPNISLLHITFLLPYPKAREFDAFHQKVSAVTADVFRHVRWLIPFFKDHLQMVLPNFIENRQNLRHYQRSLEKLSLLRGMYDSSGLTAGKGSATTFRNQTAFRNLFLTGPEVFPALGFEGETISSLNTANLGFETFQQTTAIKKQPLRLLG